MVSPWRKFCWPSRILTTISDERTSRPPSRAFFPWTSFQSSTPMMLSPRTQSWIWWVTMDQRRKFEVRKPNTCIVERDNCISMVDYDVITHMKHSSLLLPLIFIFSSTSPTMTRLLPDSPRKLKPSFSLFCQMLMESTPDHQTSKGPDFFTPMCHPKTLESRSEPTANSEQVEWKARSLLAWLLSKTESPQLSPMDLLRTLLLTRLLERRLAPCSAIPKVTRDHQLRK